MYNKQYNKWNNKIDQINRKYDDDLEQIITEMENDLIENVFTEHTHICCEEDTVYVDIEESDDSSTYVWHKQIKWVECEDEIISVYYGNDVKNYVTFDSMNFDDAYNLSQYLKKITPMKSFDNCFKLDCVEVFENEFDSVGKEYFEENDVKSVYQSYSYYLKKIPLTYDFQVTLLSKYPEMFIDFDKKHKVLKEVLNAIPDLESFAEGDAMGFFSIKEK